MKNRWMHLKLNIKFSVVILFFMVIPIGILAGILFYVMEQNVIAENMSSASYDLERREDSLQSKLDSINMSTQFFLSDKQLNDILERSYKGEEISSMEWLECKEITVYSLERLVNSNPLLYGVRVYAATDNVQEIMPVIYQKSRMDKQAWAMQDKYIGWNFNYEDQIFSTYTIKQNQKLIAKVSLIKNSSGVVIGTVEAAMTMEDMFPSMYEDIENEGSVFVTSQEEIYCGNEDYLENEPEVVAEIRNHIPENNENTVQYLTVAQHKIVASYQKVPDLSGTIICIKDISSNVQRIRNIRNYFVIIMLLILVAIVFFINFIVKSLLRQLYDILAAIHQVQNGDMNVRIVDCGDDEMGELGEQINRMLDRINRLMEDNIKRELLMKNSEIKALQNQINAHFIYNVLESIKMMAEINEEYDISDAVTALGKLLRYSMKWTSNNVLVEQELDYIKNYMKLINLRYDYEIYLSLSLPEYVLKQEIPKMTLQPIVENAICHGIEEIAEDTNIYIKGFMEGKDCIIEITDPGKGMTEEEIETLKKKIDGEIDSNGGSGNGIGLKNVQDRIHIAFGEKYGIEVASKKGMYTKIKVRIPMLHAGIEAK